jgi:glycosyltransferase involved in cell wall biosynthesis
MEREFLLDVTRLLWRAWRRRKPTGIDRVCLAYLERFAGRSLLVIRRGGWSFVLSPRQSDRLARLLHHAPGKVSLVSAVARAMLDALPRPPRPDMIYLNVGHTGLDDGALRPWIARNGVRAVYMVHDLIPLTHPQYCRAGEHERHARRMENVLATASGIIANSHDTLAQLRALGASQGLPIPPALAVPLGTDAPREPAKAHSARPYFVTVGTIEARKNHSLLLSAWERLVRSLGDAAPNLLIIGQRGWEAEETFRSLDKLGPLEGHVTELTDCGDEELAGWVADARALLMPSFVEGFGLPVVEALQLGTPVIATDLAVYREIAGDIPTYLDPHDPGAWEEAVRSFVDDCGERRRQVSALESFRAPTWPDHFEVVEDWLQQL